MLRMVLPHRRALHLGRALVAVLPPPLLRDIAVRALCCIGSDAAAVVGWPRWWGGLHAVICSRCPQHTLLMPVSCPPHAC